MEWLIQLNSSLAIGSMAEDSKKKKPTTKLIASELQNDPPRL